MCIKGKVRVRKIYHSFLNGEHHLPAWIIYAEDKERIAECYYEDIANKIAAALNRTAARKVNGLDRLHVGASERRDPDTLFCPKCNQWQTVEWERVHWPARVTAAEMRRDELAYYQCAHCGAHLGSSGIKRRVHLIFDGEEISWSELAAEYLEAQQTHESMRAFYEGVLGLPWREKQRQKRKKP